MGKRPCWKKLLVCIFSPIILVYQSIRIFCCECIAVLLGTVCINLKACCCGLWSCFPCCSKQYTDKEFPPSAECLEDGKDVEWQRLDDVCRDWGGKPQLFEGVIDAGDVSQGGIGDCWLMSAIASLAEYPDMIRKLFITKRYSAYGKYDIWLYEGFARKWTVVTVDNWVPCRAGTFSPIYAQPHKNEMWAALLEKAVAKYCKGFKNIIGGNEWWALKLLTGLPTFLLERVDKGGTTWRRKEMNMLPPKGDDYRRWEWSASSEQKEYSMEDLFYILREYDDRQSIMATGTYGALDDTNVSPQGIVMGHAYTLVGAQKVGDALIVKLRNPWGRGEWTGDWSDKSTLWDAVPEARKRLCHEAKDDGAFWMPMQDFVKLYPYITVCVRDTGFKSLTLDVSEERGACCGPTYGCVAGCCGFWCKCRGCKALCCGEEADEETVEGRRTPRCCPCL
eukprot:TRINITY_DN14908_c0_g1_i1.p1 TRINITY_DN14908_c0_g1~~TRINITY_DN14908_c0_g1_i1.p1  ORF type:complete len:449 (+),score=105.36 TRINITY_DN14908_c0_g1_i1:61-1407(+)